MQMKILGMLSDLELHICAKLNEIRQVVLHANKTTETKSNGLGPSPPLSLVISPLPVSSSTPTPSPSPVSSTLPASTMLPTKPTLPDPLLPTKSFLTTPLVSQAPFSSSHVLSSIVKTEPLKYIQVSYDKYVDVTFSYVFSSRNFFVNPNSALVEDFYVKLNNRYGADIEKPSTKASLKLSKVEVKQLVCVYSEEELSYYRCQVLKICEDGAILVRFIDFGDLVKVKADFIFALYPDFFSAPAMAVHCFLDGLWERNTSTFDSIVLNFLNFPEPTDYFIAARVKFHPSVDGVKYPVSVIAQTKQGEWKDLIQTALGKVPHLESITQYVFTVNDFSSLNLSGNNFEKSPEAFDKFLKVFPNTMLNIGSEYPGKCVHVSCVNKFAFANEGAFELITNMSFYYRGYPECASADIPLKEQSLVVFSIGKFFYRGFVISTRGDDAEVFSVDLGFTKLVPSSSLLLLVDIFSLAKSSPKAIICGLEKIVPAFAEWSAVATYV